MRKKIFALLAGVAITFGGLLPQLQAQQSSNISYIAGERVADRYAYGYGAMPGAHIVLGNSSTGTQTVVACPAFRATGDGRIVNIFPTTAFAPISFDTGTAIAETVTPTSVSLVSPPSGVEADQSCAAITGSFTYAHYASQNTGQVRSGTFGLQEAIDDAGIQGGEVVIGTGWTGTNAMITAATVFPGVSIVDRRTGVPRYWNPTATGVSLAAPTGVNVTGQLACDATHQMCSDATVAGSASWGGAVYACWAYVDIAGNEGPCSATTTWTSAASKAIDLGIPPASPGAVGAVPYLSLSGGTYLLAYQIPVTSTVCTLTNLETVTPACAVANATYGQSASTYGAGGLFTTGGAQITTYPVNTAMTYTDLATTAQTLAGQHALTNSSVTYAFAPGNRVGGCGYSSSNIVQLAAASSISGSSATTVTQPVATWTIPAGCFNYIGAEFRVTGKFTYTDGGSGTSQKLFIAWDANGTNTASVPTALCSILDTFTSVSGADNVTYSCTVKVLTTGTAGTALVNGITNASIAAGQTTLLRTAVDNAVAASAAINLATNARISVIFEAVGATSNPGAQGLSASLEVLN